MYDVHTAYYNFYVLCLMHTADAHNVYSISGFSGCASVTLTFPCGCNKVYFINITVWAEREIFSFSVLKYVMMVIKVYH